MGRSVCTLTKEIKCRTSWSGSLTKEAFRKTKIIKKFSDAHEEIFGFHWMTCFSICDLLYGTDWDLIFVYQRRRKKGDCLETCRVTWQWINVCTLLHRVGPLLTPYVLLPLLQSMHMGCNYSLGFRFERRCLSIHLLWYPYFEGECCQNRGNVIITT